MGLFNGFRKTKDRPRSPSAAEAQKQQQQQQQRDQQRDQAQAQPQPQQQQQQQQQKRSVAYADPPAASEQDEQGLEDSVPQHLAQEPYSAPEPYPEPGMCLHSLKSAVGVSGLTRSHACRHAAALTETERRPAGLQQQQPVPQQQRHCPGDGVR